MNSNLYAELLDFSSKKMLSIGLGSNIHHPSEFVNQAYINGISKLDPDYKGIIYGLILNTKRKLDQSYGLSDHELNCKKCGTTKMSFYFHLKLDKGAGLMEDIYSFYSHCKDCHKTKSKKYRDSIDADPVLKEQQKLYAKQYYKLNREKLLARSILRQKTQKNGKTSSYHKE